MKKISNKVGTICLYITFVMAMALFAYMLVFEGTNVAW